MRDITIADARRLGRETGARGIVIIQFREVGFELAASYGEDRYRCRQLGQWLEKRARDWEASNPWDEKLPRARCKKTMDMFED